jgi:hypothetical protein
MSTADVTTLSADIQRVTQGSYSATRVSIRNFVADLGHFALNRWRALPDNSERQLEDGIGLLFLSAIESISIIAAERDSSNVVTSDKLPPVIPLDLANISPQEFNEVVLKQSQRLNLTGCGRSGTVRPSLAFVHPGATPKVYGSRPTNLPSSICHKQDPTQNTTPYVLGMFARMMKRPPCRTPSPREAMPRQPVRHCTHRQTSSNTTRNPQRMLRATLILTHAVIGRTTPPHILSVFMTTCARERAIYTAIDNTRTRAHHTC